MNEMDLEKSRAFHRATAVPRGPCRLMTDLEITKCFARLRANRYAHPATLTDAVGPGSLKAVIRSVEHNEQVDVVRGDLVFPSRLMEVRMLFRVGDCCFPAAGKYEAVLTVDGEWVAHRRLRVYQRQEGS